MTGKFQLISRNFIYFPTLLRLNPRDYKSLNAIMQVHEDHASECICFVEGLSYKWMRMELVNDTDTDTFGLRAKLGP